MAEETEKHEKTEDATPRKRQEAREKGQVALSTELLVALGLCVGFAAVAYGGGAIASASGGLIERSLATLAVDATSDLSAERSAALVAGGFELLLAPALAVIVPLLVTAVIAGYVQVGFQVTPQAIAWDLARLNPLKGWSRIASRRSLVRSTLALAKILVITTAMVTVAAGDVGGIAALCGSDLGPMLAGLGTVVAHCAVAGLVAIVAIAVVDFGFQRWQHESDLKMSKKEIKDEARSTEGDPHIKGKIRQIQREMARRRMMADVPTATVVVTNPTHYAVALRYERADPALGEGARPRAPRVVAKGVDLVAQRIKAVAAEAGVPAYEDVPLARALHAQVEIGQEIPEALYQAVASVLAYVYRLEAARVSA